MQAKTEFELDTRDIFLAFKNEANYDEKEFLWIIWKRIFVI